MLFRSVQEKTGNKLVVLSSLDALHQHFAECIAEEIKANNIAGRPTKLILPVGPVGQYPILADIVNSEEISLKQCWFFMMDEHCDDRGAVLPNNHPLSFRGHLEELFLRRVERNLAMPAEQVVFPSHRNVDSLSEKVESLGTKQQHGIGVKRGSMRDVARRQILDIGDLPDERLLQTDQVRVVAPDDVADSLHSLGPRRVIRVGRSDEDVEHHDDQVQRGGVSLGVDRADRVRRRHGALGRGDRALASRRRRAPHAGGVGKPDRRIGNP